MATYELLKQEGSAKRAVFHTVHGDIRDAGVYECGNGGRNQGCCFNNGSQRDQMSGGTVQYLSSACASRRQADQRNGRTA